jgi:predicted nucleic acid-binding protein
MRVFVDTSALYALLDASDQYHPNAVEILRILAQQAAEMITTNYVIVETIALVQNRLGMQAVNDFIQHIKPLLEIVWVTENIHQAAEAILLSRQQRRLSLVDCVSFVVMRELGISTAFANDQHFSSEGFSLL